MKKIAAILDERVDNLSRDFVFPNNELDSLGVLALSAAIDELYDIVVPVSQLRQVTAIRDVFDLIEAELDE